MPQSWGSSGEHAVSFSRKGQLSMSIQGPEPNPMPCVCVRVGVTDWVGSAAPAWFLHGGKTSKGTQTESHQRGEKTLLLAIGQE